jgi:hypothetical protein
MKSTNHPATHLHWSYSAKDSNRLLNETKSGLAVCGAQAPHGELTVDIANVTCPQCKAKAKAAEALAEPPMDGHSPLRTRAPQTSARTARLKRVPDR